MSTSNPNQRPTSFWDNGILNAINARAVPTEVPPHMRQNGGWWGDTGLFAPKPAPAPAQPAAYPTPLNLQGASPERIFNMGQVNGVGQTQQPSSVWDGAFGENGWFSPVAQTGLGMFNAWQGMQALDLGKDQLAFQRDAFERNYANQVQTLNTALEDRQRARVSADPTAHQNVDDYMNRNKV